MLEGSLRPKHRITLPKELFDGAGLSVAADPLYCAEMLPNAAVVYRVELTDVVGQTPLTDSTSENVPGNVHLEKCMNMFVAPAAKYTTPRNVLKYAKGAPSAGSV